MAINRTLGAIKVTVKAKISFTVKEHAGGEPWIAIETVGGGLDGLTSGFFGFVLQPGTGYEKAKEISAYLNSNIEQLTFTRL
jgi:hypothetical protein